MSLNRRLVCFGVIGVFGASFLLGWTRPVQQGSTWTMHFDDPNKHGTQTTVVTVSFIDALGKKQTRTITAVTELDSSDGADSKRQKVEDQLSKEVAKAANRFDGVALVVLSGQGNVIAFSPTVHPQGKFTAAKIDKVETKDGGTNETDKVIKPNGEPAIAEVGVEGEITGSDGSGSSVYCVATDVGEASIALTPGMRKIDLIDRIRAALVARGADAWIDPGRLVVLVLLKDSFYSVGAGTDDQGLIATVAVFANSSR